MKRWIAALILSVLLVSCGESTYPTEIEPNAAVRIQKVSQSVYRIADTEYGVICYVYGGYGISCLPMQGR